ncbi:hypothetical protein [Streptomyces sp. NBC_01244]|uniref:hypothetical protein n=1 Tax=Streptomyces sp. NBC_01244 TaxID=2903797 RepID=UPI002E0ED8FB|nr:hypothetical protein OG247_17995 [Streptomyces sp. NBC_01244]
MSEREHGHFVYGVDVTRPDWHNEMMKDVYRTETKPFTPAPGTHKERTAAEVSRNELIANRYRNTRCRVCKVSRDVDAWVVYMPSEEVHVVLSCWDCGQQVKAGKIEGDTIVPLG